MDLCVYQTGSENVQCFLFVCRSVANWRSKMKEFLDSQSKHVEDNNSPLVSPMCSYFVANVCVKMKILLLMVVDGLKFEVHFYST